MNVRMIAHDMRTPLSALTLSLQILKAKSAPELHPDLEIAQRNVHAVAEMVEALLATSESGPSSKGSLVLHECFAVELVASAIDQVAPLAAAKALRLESDDLGAVPPMVAEGAKLTRVLVNLLNNAVKFSPEGGHIHVGAKHRDNDGHPSIVFSVTDSGPGVSEEDIHRIFEAGISIAKKGPCSNGLGLAVCKEIVEAHKGRIWVEIGTVKKGATFSFAIPIGLVPTPEK